MSSAVHITRQPRPLTSDGSPRFKPFQQANVTIAFDPVLPEISTAASRGTIFITENGLQFIADNEVDSEKLGFEVKYASIALHAITNPGTIYCQLIEGGETSSDIRALEIRPPSQSSLEAIFEAISTCSALDLEQILGEAGDIDRLPGDASEAEELRAAARDHLDSIFEPISTSSGHDDTNSK